MFIFTNSQAVADSSSSDFSERPADQLLSPILETTLDAIACGILILDSQMRIIYANAAGQMQLKSAANCLGVDSNLTFYPLKTGEKREFLNAFAKARMGKRSMLSLDDANNFSMTLVPLGLPQQSGPNKHKAVRHTMLKLRSCFPVQECVTT